MKSLEELRKKTRKYFRKEHNQNQTAEEILEFEKAKKILEKKLSHIKESLTLSIIGCVVNGPGEASQTDIGLTGGGKGNNMIYLHGLADHKVASEEIIDHVVSLVENKAAEIRAES